MEGVTHISSSLLDALGVQPGSASMWAEDTTGDMWRRTLYFFDPDHPLRLDPNYAVVIIAGDTTGEDPTPTNCGVAGAFMELRPMASTSADDPAETQTPARSTPTFFDRVGSDFANPAHGAVYDLLRFDKTPKTQQNAATWRKNSRKRYKISTDGHLVYLAFKRSRADIIRTIHLTTNPTRIIPFDDEIDTVGHTPNIT
jgi:hypothetical protein